MLKKLRIKFVVVNMSIVLAMLLIIFGMLFSFTKIDLEKDAQALLRKNAQDALQLPNPKTEAMDMHYFTVRINARSEVSSYGYTAFDLDDGQFIQEVVYEALGSRHQEGFIRKYDLQYYKLITRDLIVISFVEQSVQQEVLQSLLITGSIVGGVSLLVFFVISLFLAKWIVRPVDVAWKKQKRFISDASHELKTPLAVIMANAELMQSTENMEEKDRYCSNIFHMSVRMRGLVEGMLDLSRVDNGQVKNSFQKLTLSDLVEEALLPFEPMFFENDLTLQSNVEQGIAVSGNDRYLSQVVHILLDNALKYSAPGIVELQLQRYGRSQALLTVSNPGNPIGEAERERIFDRFYRQDEARTGSGSFGLGLAIAKSLVTEHGGRIWVDSNKTGNCFCVLLPCM